MPKKKEPDDPKAQSDRFKKAAQELIDAGELNPTEADKALDGVVRGVMSNETHVVRTNSQNVQSDLDD
jgi:polyhydroxyalkanoate synthesis regulator phasin